MFYFVSVAAWQRTI